MASGKGGCSSPSQPVAPRAAVPHCSESLSSPKVGQPAEAVGPCSRRSQVPKEVESDQMGNRVRQQQRADRGLRALQNGGSESHRSCLRSAPLGSGGWQTVVMMLWLVSLSFFNVGCRAQVLCPYLVVNGGPVLEGTEDKKLAIDVNMYHLDPINCDDVVGKPSSQLNVNPPNNSNDRVLLQAWVQHGKLFLENGFTLCDVPIISPDFGYNDDRLNKLLSFSATGVFHEIQCLLQYISFEGIRDRNYQTNLAAVGQQPIVELQVGPECDGGPIECGAHYEQVSNRKLQIMLDPVNDLPMVSSCSTFSLTSASPVAGASQCNTNNIVQWSLTDAGDQCQNITVFHGGEIIQNIPTSAGFMREIRSNTGQLVGCAPAEDGTPIKPIRVFPPLCQNEDERILEPPFCSSLPYTSCEPDPSSFVYHIEDKFDYNMSLKGTTILDKDLWQGYLNLAFDLPFQRPGNGSSIGDNNPFVGDGLRNFNIGSQLGGQVKNQGNEYCAKPFPRKGDNVCSKSQDESLGSIYVISKFLDIRVVPSAANRQYLEAEGHSDCGINPASGMDMTLVKSTTLDVLSHICDMNCDCRSRIYYSFVDSDGDPNTPDPTFYKAIFFFEIRDPDTLALHETGYIHLEYKEDSANPDTSVTGKMYADAGKQAPFVGLLNTTDLFPASPFDISGLYTGSIAQDTTFRLAAVTNAANNPNFKVTVKSQWGKIFLPNADGSVTPPVSIIRISDQQIDLRGTIDWVNEALSEIVYKVPTSPSDFNTMAIESATLGAVNETIRILIDDMGYNGRASEIISKMVSGDFMRVAGNTTTLEYNILVVADNDGPTLSVPTELPGDTPESTWVPVSQILLGDKDAQDLQRGASGPDGGTEVQLDIRSRQGQLRIPFQNVTNFVYTKPASTRCAADCGGTLSFTSASHLLSFGQACYDCVQRWARINVVRGTAEVAINGALTDLLEIVTRLEYRGNDGYNRFVPDNVESVYGNDGCDIGVDTTLPGGTESVVFQISDLGNAGCLLKDTLTASGSMNVIVDAKEDFPRMLLVQQTDGEEMDVCAPCLDEEIAAPCTCSGRGRNEPDLKIFEDDELRFSADTFQMQIRDFDTKEKSFANSLYTLTLNSTIGHLVLPAQFDDQLVQFSGAGTAGCQTCKQYELTGDMCEINRLLRGTKYVPIKDYNAEFGLPETLVATAFQTTAGSPHLAVLRMALQVDSANDNPRLNLNKERPATFAIATEWHDFLFFKEGDTTMDEYCANQNDGVTCIEIYDADACEARFLQLGIKPAPGEVERIQQGINSVCVDRNIVGGNLSISIRTNFGDIQFFMEEEARPSPNKRILGEELGATRNQGKSNRELDLDMPLSWYLGGVLRYYSSKDFKRIDSLSFTISDQGNTGAQREVQDFCCCTDQACTDCIEGECALTLDVSACEDVPSFVCKDAVSAEAALPGWAIAAITIGVFGFFAAGTVGIVHLGQRSALKESFLDNHSDMNSLGSSKGDANGNPPPKDETMIAI